jgi:hypothetical protein
MGNIGEVEFNKRLYEEITKLSSIAKSQSYRFKKEWEMNLAPFNPNPHLLRTINYDKEKFLSDIGHRIEVLKTVKLCFEDGFHSIKCLLLALYYGYLKDSEQFISDFSEQDRLILKYYIAFKILGDLIQYNKMDHESVPLKYNIIARNYLLMKLKGQSASEVLENMKKINVKLTLKELRKILDEIIKEGIITKTKKGSHFIYKIKKELELSNEGKVQFNRILRPLIDWPTGIWRSLYNIREMNITVDNAVKYHEYLNNVLEKAATQGYSAAHFVIKNLVSYYEKIKQEG